MKGTRHPIYTIGHSSHPIDTFVLMLQRHRVDEVVDVRSSPYSSYMPHFNSEVIGRVLDQIGVRYVFSGRELGGRPMDPSCYGLDGRVRYDKVANTDQFDHSIRDLTRWANGRRLALMCTEKDPLDCHRALLVAQSLVAYEVDVEHILADGSLENHDDALDRLAISFKLPPNGDMFRDRAAVIEEAIARQTKKVGYISELPVTSQHHWSN